MIGQGKAVGAKWGPTRFGKVWRGWAVLAGPGAAVRGRVRFVWAWPGGFGLARLGELRCVKVGQFVFEVQCLQFNSH